MAKFAQVAAGKQARKPYELASVKGADGKPVTVDLIVLTGDEEADVNEFARVFSLEKKGTGEPSDPSYELGAMAKTLALSVLDADAAERQEPFFSSEREVLKARELGRDGIAHLFEQQKMWQREISPGVGAMSADEFVTIALEVARVKDPSPFYALGLSSQQSWVLFTANLLSTLLTSRSAFGLGSAPVGEGGKLDGPPKTPSESPKAGDP